jgi:hypothetical protein
MPVCGHAASLLLAMQTGAACFSSKARGAAVCCRGGSALTSRSGWDRTPYDPPEMYRWLVRKGVGWLFAELRAGRTRWLFVLLADDVHFRFLGDQSWPADFHSKVEAKRWLDRFVQVGLQLHPQEMSDPWHVSDECGRRAWKLLEI